MIARSVIQGSEYKAVKIFYSYSRMDSALRDAFDGAMSGFKWDIAVEPWYDGNIRPGDPWEECIFRNLNASDIILLFISNSFLRSRYCYDIEMKMALDLHKKGKARVIPIILEETDPDWRKEPFAVLQVLPQNGRPVSAWSDPGEALSHISQSIINLISDEGLNPYVRCRWKLSLDGELSDFKPDEKNSVIQSLRDISGDPGLRPMQFNAGSITVDIESQSGAYDKVRSLFNNGSLSHISNYRIIDVKELYGAGIRVESFRIEDSPDTAAKLAPDPELLLFPSKATRCMVLNGIYAGPDDLRFGFYRMDPPEILDKVPPLTQELLLDMFYTALAVPDEDVWVNFGPDDKNHMLPPYLASTIFGQILLDADYQLKRLSASLLHPGYETGKAFWRSVFSEAHRRFGAANLPCNAFMRVWIVPETAEIYESPEMKPNMCFINKASMNVMCERDYLAIHGPHKTSLESTLEDICYSVFKESVLPVIKNEVNHGLTFTPLRKLYHSLILARWCKNKTRDNHAIKGYIDSLKEHENDSIGNGPGAGPSYNDLFYDKYMELFKNGLFYEVRYDYDPLINKKITRSYFSGSIDLRSIEFQSSPVRSSINGQYPF